MKTMYPAQANSPGTELAAAIDAVQTTITLVDASRLPAASNLATIGTDDSAETVLYTGVSGNDLTGVTRGFQGEAQSWVAGSKVARYLTAYDIDSMRENIEETNDNLEDHVTDPDAHPQYAKVADVTAQLAEIASPTTLGRVKIDGTTIMIDDDGVISSVGGGDVQSTKSGITYYVNATSGSDSNDGLTAETPFATIQYAINLLPQVVNHDVSILVAPGTYNETVSISGFMGRGSLDLRGTGGTQKSINNMTIRNCSLPITVRTGFNATSTSATIAFDVDSCANVTLTQVTATTTDQTGIRFFSSVGALNSSTISNKAAAIFANARSTLLSSGNSGTGNTVVLQSYAGSTLIKSGSQPSGTTAEATNGGGLIR